MRRRAVRRASAHCLGRSDSRSSAARNAPVPRCTRSTRAASAPGPLSRCRESHPRGCRCAPLRLSDVAPLRHALAQRASRAFSPRCSCRSHAQRHQPSAAAPTPARALRGLCRCTARCAQPSAAAHALAAAKLRPLPSSTAALGAAAACRTPHAERALQQGMVAWRDSCAKTVCFTTPFPCEHITKKISDSLLNLSSGQILSDFGPPPA